MKNSYLNRGDFNVIIVDWSFISIFTYEYARYKVKPIGIAVSQFVDWMNVNFATLHLVGYDLGKIKILKEKGDFFLKNLF